MIFARVTHHHNCIDEDQYELAKASHTLQETSHVAANFVLSEISRCREDNTVVRKSNRLDLVVKKEGRASLALELRTAHVYRSHVHGTYYQHALVCKADHDHMTASTTTYSAKRACPRAY